MAEVPAAGTKRQKILIVLESGKNTLHYCESLWWSHNGGRLRGVGLHTNTPVLSAFEYHPPYTRTRKTHTTRATTTMGTYDVVAFMFCADNGNRERRCMSATMGPDRVAIVGALSAHNRHTEMTTQPNNWISTQPWVGRWVAGPGGGPPSKAIAFYFQARLCEGSFNFALATADRCRLIGVFFFFVDN